MFDLYKELYPSAVVDGASSDCQQINYKKYSPLYFYDGKTIPGLSFAIYRNVPVVVPPTRDSDDEDDYELVRKDSLPVDYSCTFC